MRKKIFYLYGTIFIALFLVLFSLNYVYKKFVIDLKVGNEYSVSAHQFFGFKTQTLDKLFDQVLISEEEKYKAVSEKIYQIRNLKKQEFSLTLNNPRTFITFDLKTRDYFDENDLEKKVNKIYIGSIRSIINDIEDNQYLFDYEEAIKFNNLENEKIIERAFDRLINSKFFEKYPPQLKCLYNTKNICLGLYSNYYNSIYIRLSNDEISETFIKKFTGEQTSNLGAYELLKDFNENRPLFDYPMLSLANNNVDLSFINLKKKYNELVKSEFFLRYLPKNYCISYGDGCFEELSDHFNSILIRHKREIVNPFKISIVKPKKKFNFIIEAPTIFGITAIIIYILFILTNKFFIRKLR